ncbi:MAG: voltage-dependent potassium channel beta subunit [Planctomycetota bacterium]|jgi:voltage-dependent potassium channel beta subunit
MKYRKLGSSGLKVSEISLGGWITFGGTIPEDDARAIVHRAIDGGVNYIDFADVYARGKAEQVFGRMLGEYNRDNLILASKVFWPMGEDPNERGLSRKHIMRSVDRSLQNMQTDHLDFYYCHREDPETDLEETMSAMDDLVRQGKVLYWGTSVWSAESLEAAHTLSDQRNLYRPKVEQPEYSLVERSIEKSVMPTASKNGMGIVVWSPLAGGMLTGKYNDGVPAGSRATKTHFMENKLTPKNLERVRKFCALAQDLGHAPEHIALAWILSHPEITSVITGATRAEHIDSNLKASDLVLGTDVIEKLNTLFSIDK